jgi:hypothetical protein
MEVPATPDVFASPAESLAPSGNTVPAPAMTPFTEFTGYAGASDRPIDPRPFSGQGPQDGNPEFDSQALAPDATPPAMYEPIVNQPGFELNP